MHGRKVSIYEFDHFLVDPHRRLVLERGKPLPLSPKALDLLLILIGNRDRVVPKEELLQTLWPKLVVEESNLTQNVLVLRKALGEAAHDHRYIVNIPGRGYRFVCRVRVVAETHSGFSPEMRTPEAQNKTAQVRRVIAVLPFRPLSTDPNEEYLGHGLAEALATKLSGMPHLTVRPTTGLGLKDHGLEQEPQRIGRRLGVASIIYGTLLRQGERVRIALQSMSVKDAALHWAFQFEGRLTEVFTLQDEMVTHVARALAPELTSEERQRLKRRQTENTDAYLTYLRGRYFLSRRTPEGFRKAAACFEQASQMDPDYALAFAGSADCHCLLACYSVVAPLEAWPKAKSAALRALELDSGLAEAHAALGLVQLGYERNWPASERACLRALELNPDLAIAHDYYAECLSSIGRHEEAIAAIKRAQELDPLSLIIDCDVGANLFRARKYSEAVKQLENTVAMDPSFAVAHYWLGWAYEMQGMYQQALSRFEEAFTLFDNGPPMLASLGHAYAVCGDGERANKVVEQLLEISRRRYVSAFDMALPYAGLGDKDQVLGWLEKACLDRPWQLIYLKADPRLDPVRTDPRFKTLVHRLGLPG
jgi:DNA-binding winged helix-turn-helix (wHTH) protein/tetratricopeptide (TPR) repeat protein